MESVGVLNAIEVLQVARRRRKEEYRKIEDEQVAEHEKLMAKIRILKEEKKNTKENIGKNLRSLTLHEHSIRKLLYAGEDTAGLPISTECHRQTGALLSEGIQFMNAVQNIYEDLSDSTKDKNINSADLLSDIKSCAESIGSELYRAKSAIVQAETIRVNTDALQEHYHVTNVGPTTVAGVRFSLPTLPTICSGRDIVPHSAPLLHTNILQHTQHCDATLE